MILPNEAIIELTCRCNQNCEFCFNEEAAISSTKKEMKTSKILAIIDEIAQSGIKAIRFTGGEPFLVTNLQGILKYAKSKGIKVILNTNGLLAKKQDTETKEILKNSDYVVLSLHDTALFDKKSNFLSLSSNFKCYTMCCTIATRQNIRNLEKYYKFVKERKEISEWFLLRPVPTGKNRRPVEKEDIKKLAENIIKLNKKYNLNVRIANAVPFCAYDKNKMNSICAGGIFDDGYSRIFIDSSGRIWPSYSRTRLLGKIGKNKIIECWNSGYMKNIRALKNLNKRCRKCNCMEKCKGGLRSAADIKTGMDYLAGV